MHSNIVNGQKLLWDAHTVLVQHRGTAALFVLLTVVLFAFSFCMFVTLTVLFLFLGASIVKQSKEDSRLFCDSPTGHLSVHTLGTSA